MPRPEKVQAVADIKERLEESVAVFLAEYAGLSVSEQQELRRGLRAAGGEFKVVKMTLARLAAEELGHESLLDDLSGPTGLAFASGDAAAAAKALKEFAKVHDRLVLKSGLLRGEPLTPERVSDLAELDSREVLLAKVAGAFQAPMLGMANLMAALPRNLATMLQQLIDKTPVPAEAATAPDVEASPTEASTEGAEASADAATDESEELDASPSDASDELEASTDDEAAETAEAEEAEEE